MEEVFGAILSGNAVFFLDGYDKAMKISSKGYPGLAVSEVKTEKVLRGSKEGFCDSVKTNAALVRKRIRDTIGFDNIPEPLAEIAQARLDYPEATLKELGTYLDPPVGKSGVNHRLRKLAAIAENLI